MTAEASTGPVQAAGAAPQDDAAAAAGPNEWSLLVRLAWIATAAVLISLVFGGFAMFRAVSIESDQMLEARLEQMGATIQSLVEEHVTHFGGGGSIVLPHLKTRPTAALLYRYQVWSRHGSLLLRSHEAPEARPMGELTRFGYSTGHIDGEEYRVFTLPTRDGEFVIQVAENVNEVWSQVGLATAYYVGLLLIPFALVIAATWWLLHRALHSIHTLADSLRNRNPLEVTAINVASAPREMVPILAAMQMLFGRMQRALSVERTFTSLAAHEMRTPLAGLRANAQLLRGGGLSPEATETAVALIGGVDRATHLLDQLLDLARIEGLPAVGAGHLETVRIAAVLQDVLKELRPRIQKKAISISAEFRAETLRCHGFALNVLLRNLVSNAILYSPAGGQIVVLSMVQGEAVVLAVDDAGKGIAAEDRERAFERFNRLGRTQADGVGLGLSIVLSVVEMHQAKVQLLDSPLGGLRAQVVFPQPGSDTAGPSV